MTMSSSLQLPSEASLASVRSEPLLDHSPSPTYQQSLRSRSAAGARNHEKNKSDNIIYPLEEQANQLEQQSDAWMQDEKEQSSSLTADLSCSYPDLRTIPLIRYPLHDTRPHTAASVLNTRRNKVAPAAPAGTFHELRSLSPDVWVTGRGTSASPSTSHTSFTTPSSARWRRNQVYPSISATEVTSSDPGAPTGEISGDDNVFMEEATGEVVMNKQLSPCQSLGDGADSLIQSKTWFHTHSDVFSVPKASSPDSDSSHVPYIPFHCAQEALTVVVNDMQSMKSRHVAIVEQILNAYNDIEQESKSQYRGFVLRLKQQHNSKVGAYKEVVKSLQDELNNMSTHWEGTVKSITHHNRGLLEENKVLYQKVKGVLEKTQEEKERTAVYFTKRLDKERAKHNKLMSRARETMVQFHRKAKKRLTLMEEDSQAHLSREKDTHSQELHALERELEQSIRQLTELTTSCNVKGTSLTVDKVAPVMDVVESSPVPKTQHIETSAPDVATVAATVEKEGTDHNVRSTQSLQGPAGKAVPAAHSLIKISPSVLSISDDTDPIPTDGEPTNTTVTVDAEDEFVDNTTVAKDTQEVGSNVVDAFTVDKETKETIVREKLPSDDEEELTVAQVAILAGVDEAVVEEPQDNAAAKEVDEREMETGNQPLQDEDEQLSVVTSNGSGASTGDTKPGSTAAVQNGDPRLQQEYRKLQKQVTELKKQHQKDLTQLKTLEKEAGNKGTVGSIEDKRELKKKENEIKDAQKQCNIAKNNLTKIQSQLLSIETELASLKKNHDRLSEEMRNKETELAKLSSAAKDGAAAIQNLDELQEVTKKQSEEIRKLVSSFNSERVLRKKYYNMIEDMKGKIRVYCRVRPLSSSEKERKDRSVIESPDEYSVHVRTTRTTKEYQFDQVFTAEHSQEKVFEDTKNLIQSAVDGYNVCLFAYGQTGSGKTYTMIGGKDSKGVIASPGIAPRAFSEIYRILDANSDKFSFSVACYMLELYNDRLIDLFNPKGKEPAKLDIKKDKKGMVVVQGSISHPTDSSDQLLDLFETGSKNRHVSSTKMNAESSRSHLVIGIIIELTNKTNGSVHKGKLSIVDLAGSERASKSGATAEQLKEAQSINKSLSALGDVISALSSGQDFIPYRNNRLTLLMQDSLGGNAKTLMFVNISPADYNADETVTSLTYAARVKLISNDASKNAENREITRLKSIIAALKKGEELGEDDLEL